MSGLRLGIGWRRELAHFIQRSDRIDFVEVLAEHLDPAKPLPGSLLALRERGCRFVLHGVGLSLGGAEPLDPKRLERLARVAEKLEPVHASEHVSFVRAGGLDSGHLLPLPRTERALDVLCENVREARRVLGLPLALENIASLFEWPSPEMDEATFLARALEASDSALLLDAANLHANARNHGWAVESFLDTLPLERLAYVHVAGGVQKGKLFHDTHAHPVSEGALSVLAAVCRRVASPAVLLERDDAFPSHAELRAELDAIARVTASGGTGCAAERTFQPAPDAGGQLGAEGAFRPATDAGGQGGAKGTFRPAPDAAGQGAMEGTFRPTARSNGSAHPTDRSELLDGQTRLLSALLDGALVPAGFDAERVGACAESLGRKRTRGLARQYPALIAELADALSTLPTTTGEPELARVHALARVSAREGSLSDRAFIEWAALGLRRRAFGVTVRLRTEPLRVCLGLRSPGGAELWRLWGRWTRT